MFDDLMQYMEKESLPYYDESVSENVIFEVVRYRGSYEVIAANVIDSGAENFVCGFASVSSANGMINYDVEMSLPETVEPGIYVMEGVFAKTKESYDVDSVKMVYHDIRPATMYETDRFLDMGIIS